MLSFLPAPSSTLTDRQFGYVFAVIFCGIALVPLLHDRPCRLWAFVLSGFFLLMAFFCSKGLAPLNRGWMVFGMVMQFFVSNLALFLMFYLVVAPTALLMRFFGGDPLNLKVGKAKDSYWVVRSKKSTQSDHFLDQF